MLCQLYLHDEEVLEGDYLLIVQVQILEQSGIEVPLCWQILYVTTFTVLLRLCRGASTFISGHYNNKNRKSKKCHMANQISSMPTLYQEMMLVLA